MILTQKLNRKMQAVMFLVVSTRSGRVVALVYLQWSLSKTPTDWVYSWNCSGLLLSHTLYCTGNSGNMWNKFKDPKVEDTVFLHPTYCNWKLGIYWNWGFIMSQMADSLSNQNICSTKAQLLQSISSWIWRKTKLELSPFLKDTGTWNEKWNKSKSRYHLSISTIFLSGIKNTIK